VKVANDQHWDIALQSKDRRMQPRRYDQVEMLVRCLQNGRGRLAQKHREAFRMPELALDA
jgi:hypothetical protein